MSWKVEYVLTYFAVVDKDSFMKSVCAMLAQRLLEVGRWCIERSARVHIHFMGSISLSIIERYENLF